MEKITAHVEKMTLAEFASIDGVTEQEAAEWFDLEPDEINAVFCSVHEECPYIGIMNTDNEIWVFGLRSDRMVEFEQLCRMLSTT